MDPFTGLVAAMVTGLLSGLIALIARQVRDFLERRAFRRHWDSMTDEDRRALLALYREVSAESRPGTTEDLLDLARQTSKAMPNLSVSPTRRPLLTILGEVAGIGGFLVAVLALLVAVFA